MLFILPFDNSIEALQNLSNKTLLIKFHLGDFVCYKRLRLIQFDRIDLLTTERCGIHKLNATAHDCPSTAFQPPLSVIDNPYACIINLHY
ncbi:hypothetical protein T4B_11633 [Trichinella pseudospiralis]|uniref:Uncharacterized protein n=1 Tax=Trichinella pseudospiralis TaxID=6337 RepID=A0A0V1IB57_TRIPS|nr:hypothetical protein T4B_11633 [Trichinella pseudospiralis]